MEIYPAIDMKGGKAVRLIQGEFDQVTNYGDDPVEVARRWKSEGAKWLHIVDLDGARTGDQANFETLKSILKAIDLPVQFGGGVRTAETVRKMIEIGVTRCVVGTAVAKDADLAERLFQTFGDRVAVGVDARDGFVAIQGWQEHIGEKATDFVVRMGKLGAKRFIFTDIARDGMLQGINTVALAQVAAAVPHLPVIASGGVATIEDISNLASLQKETVSNVDGVIIGKALYAGTLTLSEALEKAA